MPGASSQVQDVLLEIINSIEAATLECIIDGNCCQSVDDEAATCLMISYHKERTRDPIKRRTTDGTSIAETLRDLRRVNTSFEEILS